MIKRNYCDLHHEAMIHKPRSKDPRPKHDAWVLNKTVYLWCIGTGWHVKENYFISEAAKNYTEEK